MLIILLNNKNYYKFETFIKSKYAMNFFFKGQGLDCFAKKVKRKNFLLCLK